MAERFRVQVLQSGGPEFKASTLSTYHYWDLFLGSPEFKSSVMLCIQPTGLPPASWDF